MPHSTAGARVTAESPHALLAGLIDWIALETVRCTIGSDDRILEPDDDEGPTRDVSIGSMTISSTPITIAAFSVFAEAQRYVTDAERAGTGFVRTTEGHELVDGLTWRSSEHDEAAPITQVSWTDATEFCRWSQTRLLTEAEWERCARDDKTSMLPGPLEWTADFYSPSFHRQEQRVNPTGPISGTHRVARGGTSASARFPLLPDMSSDTLTFRVAINRS